MNTSHSFPTMAFDPFPDSHMDADSVTVSLALTAHSQAQRFRQQHPQPAKAKQVYLNTLAIYAVKTYLERAGFEVDLLAGQSWNITQQTLLDVADLIVQGHGVVECRPVLPHQTVMQVPPEVWPEVSSASQEQLAPQRQAYVAVRLEASLKSATLLGFIAQVDQLKVPLTELLPLDDLMPHLLNCAKSQAGSTHPSPIPASHPNKHLIPLQQWLDGIQDNVETGWQRIEQWLLLSNASAPAFTRGSHGSAIPWPSEEQYQQQNPPLAWGFRSDSASVESTEELPDEPPDVMRRKVLSLGPSANSIEVALTVGIVEPSKQSSQLTEIWVQVTPVANVAVLPPHLVLMVLDNEGEAVMQAQSRSTEVMQLRFGVDEGELFSLKLTLDDVSITESFVL